MGGEPYWYFVPYQPNIQAALDALRAREFKAGRYNPVLPFQRFPVDADSPAPGNKHRTIEAAQEAADADGTRSILDIERIGEEPDFSTAAAVPPEELEEIFGTSKPTRAMVEDNFDFFESVERGHGIYIVLYEGEKPSEILFAGVSFD